MQPGFLRLSGLKSEECFFGFGRGAAPPRATKLRLRTAQPGFLRLSGLKSEECFFGFGRGTAPPRATKLAMLPTIAFRQVHAAFASCKYALTLWDLQSKRRFVAKAKGRFEAACWMF